MQNCYLFCLCLSFRIKVKKRYLLFEKEVGYSQLSSEWYFDVNIVRSSSISHFTKRWFKACKRFLYRFVAFKRLMKGAKRYLFSSWKRCSQKRQNGTFLQLEVMLLKVRKKYLFKNIKLCFQAFRKLFKILLIDRCQPFSKVKIKKIHVPLFRQLSFGVLIY